MRAIDLTLVLIALGVAPQAAQKPESTPPPAAKAEDSAREIAALLREKSKHQSCTATYRMISKGVESRLRISYRAPREFRLELRRDEGSMHAWILPHRWVMQSNEKGNPITMDVDTAKLFGGAASEALDKEFPRPTVRDEGPGAFFALRLHPDKPMDDGSYLETDFSWRPYRKHALGWFVREDEWNDARVDGKLLTHEYASGAKFSLSRETGWPVEIMHPAGPRMELVEFVDSVEDSDFVIPPPSREMKDVTKQVIGEKAQMMWYLQRAGAYSRASLALRDKQYEPATVHEKVGKVFKLMYAAEIHRGFERWTQAAETGLDRFVTSCKARIAQMGTDPQLREALDKAVVESKAALVKSTQDGIDGYMAKIPAFKHVPRQSDATEEPVAPEFGPEIFVTEQAAAREVFQVEIAAPLLLKFESKLREIGALK